jgi:ankyrin repeat protein
MRYESLDEAVSNLDAGDARRHLASGKNIDQLYETGDDKYGSLLHIFTALQEKEQVELLLTLGANPDVRDDAGETPLHAAASNGNASIAALLLAHRADPNLTEKRFGWTPLHMAAAKGHIEFVRLLVAEGADSKTKGNNGVTPLLLAANNSHRAVAALLAAPLTIEAALREDIEAARTRR